MGFLKVKNHVDGAKCGKQCPFIRLDLSAAEPLVQCVLFVDLLKFEVKEPRLVTVSGTEETRQIQVFRTEACKRMEEL